jgi:hypothetical protein
MQSLLVVVVVVGHLLSVQVAVVLVDMRLVGLGRQIQSQLELVVQQ